MKDEINYESLIKNGDGQAIISLLERKDKEIQALVSYSEFIEYYLLREWRDGGSSPDEDFELESLLKTCQEFGHLLDK